ncbi:formylglycine-generating enzyme family protein [Marinicella sediminis]|uniref:Formylglycine-generating enzyme family protein n=1 Tax=Marinicella sediminis TaxID=1792834 RepID=A0ABV7J782_9GAMM|nr:formylglycine-generating enzyme family protein [Marinicella sediminis]
MISFKESFMLLLGGLLIYGLYYLKTHDNLFVQPGADNSSSSNVTAVISETTIEENPKTLPQAVIEQVKIPDWLDNKGDFDDANLTLDDLLELARLSHEQDHDFFPDNQNTLFYLLKARELGVESAEIDELMTTVHASLYDQADQAIRDYDAQTLTALTARLKSIDAGDSKIPVYTDQISVMYTLQRLQDEIVAHISNNRLYEDDQKDALHTLIVAKNLDPFYPPLQDLELQILSNLQDQALLAANEQDFIIADLQWQRMAELNETHPLTINVSQEIQQLKQKRFAYLDEQFYRAINNLNLLRAADMMDELSELEIARPQMNGYRLVFERTRLYGPYQIADEFNDLLGNGTSGPTMVVMPTGSFNMGSQTGPKHQRPRHQVNISYGLAISKFEVTVEAFGKFVENTGYQTTAERNNRAKIYDEKTGRFKDKFNINWRHDYLGKAADPAAPVIHVSWEDAQAYANWLSSSTQQPYRLLSESEFEYVLGAGNETLYPWGNDAPSQVLGNYSGAKDKFKRSRIRWREGFPDYEDGFWGPAPVGTFVANLYGLHDLSGNVMEWVDDCWHDSYTRAPTDGSAWVNRGCENRVIRGGNWGSSQEEYRTVHRISASTTLTDPRLGFRVAKTMQY